MKDVALRFRNRRSGWSTAYLSARATGFTTVVWLLLVPALVASLRSRPAHASVRRTYRFGAQRWLPFVAMLMLVACTGPQPEPEESNPTAEVRQAIDTDNDGMDDAWENLNFSNLAQAAGGDFDADGMTNLEEYAHGFVPTVPDALDDADGDRYPNVFELRHGTDPNSAASVPTPAIVVNPAGGGTHTTVSAAVNAANAQTTDLYPIIGLSAGVYTGAGNTSLTVSLITPKKLLVIGLTDAARTIIDGEGVNAGWNVLYTTIVSSLTFRRTTGAFYVGVGPEEVRFVDLLAYNNVSTGFAAGVHVASAGKVRISQSTFLDNTNTNATFGNQVYIGNAAASTAVQVTNTVIWGQASGPTLVKLALLREFDRLPRVRAARVG